MTLWPRLARSPSRTRVLPTLDHILTLFLHGLVRFISPAVKLSLPLHVPLLCPSIIHTLSDSYPPAGPLFALLVQPLSVVIRLLRISSLLSLLITILFPTFPCDSVHTCDICAMSCCAQYLRSPAVLPSAVYRSKLLPTSNPPTHHLIGVHGQSYSVNTR
jgi:hypothetical protein